MEPRSLNRVSSPCYTVSRWGSRTRGKERLKPWKLNSSSCVFKLFIFVVSCSSILHHTFFIQAQHTRTCTQTYLHTCTHTQTRTYTHARAHTNIYIHTQADTCTQETCKHTCTHKHIQTSTHAHTQTYIHMYARTHIIHTCTSSVRQLLVLLWRL